MSIRVKILLNHSAAASLSITGPSCVRSWISSVHGALIASTAAVCHVIPAASALQYNQSITAKVQCHTLLKTPFLLITMWQISNEVKSLHKFSLLEMNFNQVIHIW